MKFSIQKGFTLIELLVVVSIIGVLATIVLGSLSTARDKARIAKAQVQMNEIKKLVLMAQINTNQNLASLTGSTCSECFCRETVGLITNNSCNSRWQTAVDAIIAGAGSGNSTSFYTDPWGSPYILDENDGTTGSCSPDLLWSAGPDQSHGTGGTGILSADNILVRMTTSNC